MSDHLVEDNPCLRR